MRIAWNWKTKGPYVFSRGIIDPHGGVHHLQTQFDLHLGRSVELFATQLPTAPNTWAGISEQRRQSVPILAYAHRDGNNVTWAGCKAAFDELAQVWDAADVAWWATIAENHDAFSDAEAS